MITPAMNTMLLQLFDAASQGLPQLLANLRQNLGCHDISLRENSAFEAANDFILVDTSWLSISAEQASNHFEHSPDNPHCLLLPVELDHAPDQTCLMIFEYETPASAKAAINDPDLISLAPHIRQAAMIAVEISEQIGDFQALNYVIQHHPLKALFQARANPAVIYSPEQTRIAAANGQCETGGQKSQNFEPHISKQSLNALFRLSPSEIELTQALFKGLSLNDITEERNVSKQTVRKQLQSILRKTGAQSQEELMLQLFDTCLFTRLDSTGPVMDGST